MPEHVDPIVRQAVDSIVLAVDPERFILFGSVARGESRPDSDIDLLIVDAMPFGAGHSRRSELSRIRRALWNINRPVDLVLYSADEVRDWSGSPNHLIGRSIKEGRIVYERS